jgi:predicted DNA-binding transcriptional regulator AlpA
MDRVEIAQRPYATKQAAQTGSGGHRQSAPDRNVTSPPWRVIRLAEVLRLTGIKSRETIRSLERRGLFPQRFPLIPGAPPNDRSVPKGWDEAEVLQWIADRAASREVSA